MQADIELNSILIAIYTNLTSIGWVLQGENGYTQQFEVKLIASDISIENRIYREELKESLGMNFFSPFQPEREFKVYKSCKCSQIICSRVH